MVYAYICVFGEDNYLKRERERGQSEKGERARVKRGREKKTGEGK